MIVRFFLAMLCAGLLAGLLITPIQYARVVPLILHAETFEGGASKHGHEHSLSGPQLEIGSPSRTRTARHDPADAKPRGFVSAVLAEEPGERAPGGSVVLAHYEAAAAAEGEDGAALVESRLVGTLLANLVTGAGFALVLAAASLFTGVAITARSGAIWGLAGFSVVALAPALGLPPELPAMPAADLFARQGWWAATVALTAAGVFALVLRREPWAKAAGVLLLALPHLYGAPQPADLASPVPPTLAAEFAVASLATAAAFWIMLGVLAGHLLDRAKLGDAGLPDKGVA